MTTTIEVNYKSTSSPYYALKWLNSLPDLIACDFEVASRYTDQQKQEFQEELDFLPNQNSIQAHELQQKIASDGLSHTSLTQITHFSVAWSESDSFVIITDTPNFASSSPIG